MRADITTRSDILLETFLDLKARRQVGSPQVRTVVLGDYFTIVEFDDQSVGAAMSYYQCPAQVLSDASEHLTDLASSDPLLESLFVGSEGADVLSGIAAKDAGLIVGSLFAAVVSGLSAPVINSGGDDTFLASPSLSFDLFAGARSVLIVGYGGYLDEVVKRDTIRHVHIADLHHSVRDMQAGVKRVGKAAVEQLVTFSDGSDVAVRLKSVDVACITGSALCNGTMESILTEAEECPRVIVQGQSASIHPHALFQRGVDVVTTTVKPNELLECAVTDPSGLSLRRYMEGALPWIYLLAK